MNEKHIKEVFSNEAFVKELLTLETPAQVQVALKEKDIDMTENEIIGIRDELAKLVEKAQSGEELSLEQLDDVAGGAIVAIVALTVAVVGTAIVASAGATLGVTGAVAGIGELIKRNMLRW